MQHSGGRSGLTVTGIREDLTLSPPPLQAMAALCHCVSRGCGEEGRGQNPWAACKGQVEKRSPWRWVTERQRGRARCRQHSSRDGRKEVGPVELLQEALLRAAGVRQQATASWGPGSHMSAVWRVNEREEEEAGSVPSLCPKVCLCWRQSWGMQGGGTRPGRSEPRWCWGQSQVRGEKARRCSASPLCQGHQEPQCGAREA